MWTPRQSVTQDPQALGRMISLHPTSKDIFSAVFDWIQVSSTTAQRSIYSITNEITNSQVAMLSQKGANIID